MKKRSATPRDPRKCPIVRVCFNDATGMPDWERASRLPHEAFARVTAVGYLLHRSRRGDLTLAAMVGPDEGNETEVANAIRIPGGWVTSMRRLRCSTTRSKTAVSRTERRRTT